MDCDAENNGLEIELEIRMRGYRIVLDVSEGDVSVSRTRAREWHIALRRRRCGT